MSRTTFTIRCRIPTASSLTSEDLFRCAEDMRCLYPSKGHVETLVLNRGGYALQIDGVYTIDVTCPDELVGMLTRYGAEIFGLEIVT